MFNYFEIIVASTSEGRGGDGPCGFKYVSLDFCFINIGGHLGFMFLLDSSSASIFIEITPNFFLFDT